MTKINDIVWEEPEAAKQWGPKESPYTELYQILINNPGRWARWPGRAQTVHSIATYQTEKLKKAGVGGRFEAALRGAPKRGFKGFLRYVAEEGGDG